MSKVRKLFLEGIKRGLDEIGVNTTRHFGGNKFIGSAASRFLEYREKFFDEALRDVDEDTAKDVRERYLPVMALFNVIHRDARRATTFSEKEIDVFEENVGLFCDLYRATFQIKHATPKLHLIEAHLVESLRMWKTLGIFGEEAIESIHAKVNRLRRRTHGIRNRLKELKTRRALLESTQVP